MPTAIPSGEKSAFIDIVNVKNPFEATRLATVLVNYEDIPTAIARQLDEFAANPLYLYEAMKVFTNAGLTNAGIYNDQGTIGILVTDPTLIISTIFTAGVTFTLDNVGIAILGNTSINNLTVAAGKTLGNLYIGPGATIEMLDSTATAARVYNIEIKNFKNTIGSLNAIKVGSFIGSEPAVDPGAHYGGFSNVDPSAACALPVTGLTLTKVTPNSVELSWTNPAGGFIDVIPYYRKYKEAQWLRADEIVGSFTNVTGFVFRELVENTYYDFKVVVICNNGGQSAAAEISAKTVCCGEADQTGNYCRFVILVKDTPNPANLQTLCNGVEVQKEYQSGTDLVVPYLVGRKKDMLESAIIDNTPYQLFIDLFDDITGTWYGASTYMGQFIDGNVITLNLNMP